MPTNTEDILDSRDLIARLEVLRAEICEDKINGFPISDDRRHERKALKAILRQLQDVGGDTPEDGMTLIRESYFVDYAEELAEDIGAIDPNAGWPLRYIDWEAAAQELRIDYSEVDFDGVAYLVR